MTKPVDIGTGIGISILDLAKMFEYGYSFIPDSENVGASESIADIKRAEKLFGFKAQKKLQDYIDNWS